jgi:hypothetical protein
MIAVLTLLAHIFELLPSQLLQRDRIGGLLQEKRPSLREKGFGGRVEGVEILAKPQRVELITPLLKGLGQRCPDAAALVAQEAQQANGGSTQRQWRIEVSGYIRGRKAYRQSRDHEHSRPDGLPWTDVKVQLGHPIVPSGHDQQSSRDQPPSKPPRRGAIG